MKNEVNLKKKKGVNQLKLTKVYLLDRTEDLDQINLSLVNFCLIYLT